MKGFMDMMKQAEQMQARMKEMQAELAKMDIVGESGAGLVRLTLDGHGKLKDVSIDPSLLVADKGEIVEDLLVAAHADAKAKLEEAASSKMQELTGDLPLPPGLKLF
jgi:DNA-binding YbaB/EbfC family protein